MLSATMTGRGVGCLDLLSRGIRGELGDTRLALAFITEEDGASTSLCNLRLEASRRLFWRCFFVAVHDGCSGRGREG